MIARCDNETGTPSSTTKCTADDRLPLEGNAKKCTKLGRDDWSSSDEIDDVMSHDDQDGSFLIDDDLSQASTTLKPDIESIPIDPVIAESTTGTSWSTASAENSPSTGKPDCDNFSEQQDPSVIDRNTSSRHQKLSPSDSNNSNMADDLDFECGQVIPSSPDTTGADASIPLGQIAPDSIESSHTQQSPTDIEPIDVSLPPGQVPSESIEPSIMEAFNPQDFLGELDVTACSRPAAGISTESHNGHAQRDGKTQTDYTEHMSPRDRDILLVDLIKLIQPTLSKTISEIVHTVTDKKFIFLNETCDAMSAKLDNEIKCLDTKLDHIANDNCKTAKS